MDNQEKLTTHSLESESMNRELITKCDEPFLKQVEQNLLEMIIFQNLRLRVRLFQGIFSPIFKLRKFLNKHWSKIRKTFLALCILGTLLLLYMVIFEPFNVVLLVLLVIYLIVTLIFWLLKKPYKNKNSQKFSNYIDKKSAQTSAKKILKVAKKELPFDAHYHFSDSLVNYHRLKDEGRTLVFSKELEKFAIVHNHATLFYKTSKGIVERTLIMHDGPQQMIAILREMNVEFIVYTSSVHTDLLEELADSIY
ncbi:hypothetical protein HQR03_03060 [Psychrobacter okhotskensis]|uniref:hypothetical protein n=1 Tax=Psychrobacter okhotskensis TaxID=212403 RepID=UPI0015672729|nr:hypothetical protein [Psychrobacter okhotskensis]NRD69515.1 hypothetical protein [Psychrobacter okhotskensis]